MTMGGIGNIGNIGGVGGAGGGLGGVTNAATGGASAPGGEQDGGFAAMFDSLQDVSGQADAALTDLAVGADTDMHDVVLAVEMESVGFELATQIRNRMVEAYQEIFRMQV